MSFLRDKPYVIDKVALGMQKYFNLDNEGRNLWLTNEQRLVDRLTKLSNDPKKYQLPLFLSKPTGNDSDDCRNDLREATELSICHSAWSTLYNFGRRADENIKAIAKGKTMVNSNKGKHSIDEEKEKAYQLIIYKLRNLQDKHAMPFATRVVRDAAGRSSLRDNNGNVYSPPSFKKTTVLSPTCSRVRVGACLQQQSEGKVKANS